MLAGLRSHDRAYAAKAAFGPLDFLSYETLWVEVIGDTGLARVGYTVKMRDPSMSKMPARRTALNEKWIRRDGAWYLDIKR